MALGHWAVEYLGEGMGQGGSGGGGGAMLLTVTKTTEGTNNIYTLNKTWNEIKGALAEGTQVVLYGENAMGYAQFTVAAAWQGEGVYGINNKNIISNGSYESAILEAQDKFFVADSADGYPKVIIENK